MLCPHCGTSTDGQGTYCPKCDRPLAGTSSREPVEILSTLDLSLIPVLRSILDGAEIPYEVRGDQNFSLQPAFDLLTGRERSPIVLLVPAHRAEEAKALLEAPGDEDDLEDD